MWLCVWKQFNRAEKQHNLLFYLLIKQIRRRRRRETKKKRFFLFITFGCWTTKWTRVKATIKFTLDANVWRSAIYICGVTENGLSFQKKKLRTKTNFFFNQSIFFFFHISYLISKTIVVFFAIAYAIRFGKNIFF